MYRNRLGFIVTIFVILAILLIIAPVSTFLLDMLFVLNIGLSFVILILTMYTKRSLDFSIFPSILLVTTLFRLGLNIRSTTIILGNGGEAGEIIKTFGEFIMGGDPIVGFVVFAIITLVQFIVISKGTERVAEVAARFTLDAMPGKQMAIDADLNTGALTEEQAKIRRKDVQREADFFGAMDGATKFVKGDAIAGIVITLINLIGGIIIGLVRGGMDFDTVLEVYSLATVGDGLVSQLPSLLISVSTAMIVTRTASEDSFSADVLKQFSMQPIAMIIAGSTVLSLILFNFPPIPLIVMGGMLIGLGLFLRQRAQIRKQQESDSEQMETEELTETEFYRNIDNIYSLINVNPLEIEFGYSLVPMVDEKTGGTLVDRVVMFRRQYAQDMGVVVPSVRIRDNGMINPNQYIIKLKGEPIAQGEVLVDYYLALDPGSTSGEIEGIDTIEPAYGIPSKWITADLRETAEIYGYSVIDPLSVIVTHLSEVINKNMHELLSRQDISQLVENVKKNNPLLVNELIPNVVTIADLQKVLANLLREGVPIRDLETILETVGDYIPTIKDMDMITEYVRQSLRRTITQKFSDSGQMKVITVDSDVEQIILSGIKKSDHGSYMAIDPEVIQQIVSSLLSQIEKIRDIVSFPVVLTSPVVRVYFKKIADQFCKDITVLSFSEIDSTVQIQSVGEVSVESVRA